MKKVIITCITAFYTLIAQAQLIPYTMNSYVANYTELTEDTVIGEGEFWPLGEDVQMNLGFEFTFLGKQYSSVYTYGDVLYFQPTDTIAHEVISPYFAFLEDRGYNQQSAPASPLSYTITGTPGGRVFKYQVKNAGFFDGDATDYTNFQIWLHETSNKIEFHYGEQQINNMVWPDENMGPVIAFFSQEFNMYYLIGGNDSNTQFVQTTQLDTLDSNQYFEGVPSSGRVFSFEPQIVQTIEQIPVRIGIGPNPATTVLNVFNEEGVEIRHVKIVNSKGQILRRYNANFDQINIQDILPGKYWLFLETNQGTVVKSFSKVK